MHFRWLVPIFAVTLGLAALPVAADPDARFPQRVQSEVGSLELKGAGIARVAGLIKVCAAALYAPEGVEAAGVTRADIPRRLEIEYFVGVSRERFIQLANKTLRKQLSSVELASIRDRIEALHRLYRDVEPGDRYALTYRPDQGLVLELNGETLGRVPGDDFARLYLGIWLGDKALSEGLRRQLMGLG